MRQMASCTDFSGAQAEVFVASRDAERNPPLPINQAPRRKFMIFMGLWR
jgi:hypothetical protein